MIKKLSRLELNGLFYIKEYKLYWKPRPVRGGLLGRTDNTWNTRFADTLAGTIVKENKVDYLRVYFNGKQHYAHRIIWCMLVSEVVPDIIDHLDGDGLNNNPANLRGSTHTTNMRNQSMNIRNTSGVAGVHWSASRERWVAAGWQLGATVPLGRYLDKQDAIAARLKWESEVGGFTERHGK